MGVRKQVILWGAVCAVATGWADVQLPAIFSDGMVIQRETQAPVWGSADPGETIEVNTSWGAAASVTASAKGYWKVMLKTPPAGGPFTITVSGNNTVVLSDVLAGEVWLCGGQSNMDGDMGFFTKKARTPAHQPAVEYNRHEVETANDPLLRHIEVPQTASPYAKVTDFKGQWLPVAPGNTTKMTATGYYFARELRAKLKVPVGLVECAWGGSRVEPWIAEETYRADPVLNAYYEQEMASLKKLEEAYSPEDAQKQLASALEKWSSNGEKGRKPRLKPDPKTDKQWPSTLHKGMLFSIIPYAIKGTIWYQGESNAQYMPEEYETRFSTLITSWRQEWGQGDFPFYWAQLANYKAANAEPVEEDGWASICDQQRRCLALPNTGMAVLNDIGDPRDVHPRNKVDAGRRLALWALAKDYGFKLPYSGPLYRGSTIKSGKVLVSFDQVGSGLMIGHKNVLDDTVAVDEPLKRFQIAGADRVWKWANAEIVGPDTVAVSHPDVPHPTVVRYAWSSNPEGANLYNKEGLPASLFTTE